MDRVSVNPKNIRCLGNIVSPKTVSDFGTLNGTISSGTDTVNSQSMTVYSTDYLVGSSITLSYDKLISEDDSSFTVSATLKDNTSTVVNGATVYCDVNGTVTEATTDSNGVATFTVTTDGSNRYHFRVYYNGTVSLAGCTATGTVYPRTPSNLNIMADKSIMQTGETLHLFGTVVDEDGNGVPGARVEFYIDDEE